MTLRPYRVIAPVRDRLALVGRWLLLASVPGIVAGSALAESATSGHSEMAPPNIVFIMADDLGWGDVGSYGRTDYRTPHIDRLAAQGLRFTQAYSIAPLCRSTRVGFMTGRYPDRNPVGGHMAMTMKPEHRRLGLAADPPSVAARLAASGYDTALIGKWHLGERPGFRPRDHGFGYFFGTLHGGTDYVSHVNPKREPDLWRDGELVSMDGYFTDLLTDEAVAFVARAQSPFFLSLQYTAPHWPYQQRGDPPMAADANLFQDGSMEKFAAMVTAMDEGVGRVLDALDAAGLSADTLVVFTSDNGGEIYPPLDVLFTNLAGLKGDKGELWEGGVRVPAIVRWPGELAAGGVSHQVLTTLDVAATFLAVAGAPPAAEAPGDGIDLLPILRGEAPEQERTICWRTSSQKAVRSGWWKLVATREGKGEEAVWNETLFDLVRDSGERHDLAARYPEVVERLRRALAAWEAEMLPPV